MEAIYLTEGNFCGLLNKSLDLDFAHLSITSYGSDDRFEKHYHENSYLSLLASGSYTETHKSGTTVLNSGEIIFRPAAYDHSNGFCGKPGFCFNIEFKKNWQQLVGPKLALPRLTEIYKCGTFPEIYKGMIAFLNDDHPGNVSELLLQWLMSINTPKLPESAVSWIGKVKHILENELETNHTMHSIAERVFVHPVHLSASFKKKTGFTIGEYRLQAQLKKACMLLLSSRKNITEIALECGFYDAAHFIKKYTAVFGSSPLQFRKKLNT